MHGQKRALEAPSSESMDVLWRRTLIDRLAEAQSAIWANHGEVGAGQEGRHREGAMQGGEAAARAACTVSLATLSGSLTDGSVVPGASAVGRDARPLHREAAVSGDGYVPARAVEQANSATRPELGSEHFAYWDEMDRRRQLLVLARRAAREAQLRTRRTFATATFVVIAVVATFGGLLATRWQATANDTVASQSTRQPIGNPSAFGEFRRSHMITTGDRVFGAGESSFGRGGVETRAVHIAERFRAPATAEFKAARVEVPVVLEASHISTVDDGVLLLRINVMGGGDDLVGAVVVISDTPEGIAPFFGKRVGRNKWTLDATQASEVPFLVGTGAPRHFDLTVAVRSRDERTLAQQVIEVGLPPPASSIDALLSSLEREATSVSSQSRLAAGSPTGAVASEQTATAAVDRSGQFAPATAASLMYRAAPPAASDTAVLLPVVAAKRSTTTAPSGAAAGATRSDIKPEVVDAPRRRIKKVLKAPEVVPPKPEPVGNKVARYAPAPKPMRGSTSEPAKMMGVGVVATQRSAGVRPPPVRSSPERPVQFFQKPPDWVTPSER